MREQEPTSGEVIGYMLHAEITRLRAEVERLTADCTTYKRVSDVSIEAAKQAAAERDSLHAELASAKDDVLSALGHEKIISPTCRAHRVTVPDGKPGPKNPPRCCMLNEGHEGPHRDPYGPLREPVEMRESVSICRKCRTRWPCPDAEKALRNSDSVSGRV